MEKKDGYNVLSLFGGMECGYIALKEAGIEINQYYSAEIDKNAKTVSTAVGSDIIHIGNVTNVFYKNGILYTSNGQYNTVIDFVIGGSPCQGFSFAGKQLNFDDPRSKLFFEFVRIKKEINPKYFLLENVKMKVEYKDVITNCLAVEPIEINSELVSAQIRKRIYWTNIPNIAQPIDEKIFLVDVLESLVDEKYYLSGSWLEWWNKNSEYQLMKKYSVLNSDKAITMTARQYANWNGNFVSSDILIVKEATKKGYIEVKDGECFDFTFPTSKTRRGRLMIDKSNCLTASKYDFMQFNKGRIRKLTPRECGRLQTIPEEVLNRILNCGVSDSQLYKIFGNGWTIKVI